MSLWDDNGDLLVRVIIGSAIGMGIGFGTCGLGAMVGSGGGLLGSLAALGAGIFALCGFVLVLSVLALVVRGIVGIFRK